MILRESDMFLVQGAQVWRWDGSSFSRFAEFPEPAAVFWVQGQELFLADPGASNLIAVADRQGRIGRRFGEPLVQAANLENDRANQFFAFATDGEIRVLFRYYPFYRVYSLQGELLDAGTYELPARVSAPTINPTLEELREWPAEVETWAPLILEASSHGDTVFAYFNSFTLGLLEADFRLAWWHDLLQEEEFAASPHLLSLDAASRRILFGRRDESGASLKVLTFPEESR